MAERTAILKAAHLTDKTVAELERAFLVYDLPDDAEAARVLLDRVAPEIRGIALRKTKVGREMIDRFPNLQIISSYSAGVENIDVGYARSKGITVSNTSHILAEEVANLAMGLVLCLTRDLANADAFTRAGEWTRGTFPLTRSLCGMKVGIVGLGHIGSALARRLAVTGAQIAYSGPNRKPADYPFFPDVTSLARDSDLLVLTCPLSPETRGLVTADVLDALGAEGLLVNISRGQIVDEAALIRALAENRIAGAALDVFEHEPQVPKAMIDDRRVLLTPHIGSGTHQTRQLMGDAMVDALADKLGVAQNTYR